MTEDPVKLYVVVMSILLLVLGFVAYTSWNEASAFEQALTDGPKDAERLRDYASEVQRLCDQLGRSKLTLGERTLISQAADRMGVKASRLSEQKARRIGRGRRGKERRFEVSFGSGVSKPLTREQVARFCKAVELDSQGILKTIEITLKRVTGRGVPDPGKEENVTNDTYRGSVVFGKRVVE